MYQNKVNLIGFLGSDAEVRTANNRSFTTLSLATKSSYKDKTPSGTVALSSASSPNSQAR
jgi:single-stranded DNA-binding protein